MATRTKVVLKPPGPPPVTFHPLSLLAQRRRMQRDPLERVRERFERYGDVYRIRFLGRERVVLRHPEHLQQVLVDQASCFEKPSAGPAARQLQRFLGQGLLTSNGELWRRQRRLIQPSFGREQLERYAQIVVAQAQSMLDEVRDGQSLDVSRAMMELTLRVVNKALFDLDLSHESARIASAMSAFRDTFDGLEAVLPRFLPTRDGLRMRRVLRDIDALIYGLLDAPRSLEGRDLLATLTRAVDRAGDGTGMSRALMRDELLTLLVAGHETTSHALSWTWYLLARHPDVEAKVHAELDQAIGARPPRWSDMPKLVYTEQVLSEALRLYPPAYVILRTCKETAHVGGYSIAEGTDVVLWTYHTHHDARWFADPETFDPGRFASARRKSIPSCAYLPFGAGSRTCIGKHFATMEALLLIACVAGRCSLTLAPDAVVKRDAAVTLAPRGLQMIAHHRSSRTLTRS